MAILASAIWRVRPSGSNSNGGGYDAGIGGAATDYSQQNAAQATGTNGATTGVVTTFTDATANAFTSAMIGNCIQITSGTNFTAGFYFVTAFTSASTVTLDRAPTTGVGSAGVWSLGGGWADLWTNITPAKAALQPGNTIYVLGSGTPNPASYTYDYTFAGAGTPVPGTSGTTGAGYITFANDPATPGYKTPPDTTGGMPTIKSDGYFLLNMGNNKFIGLWIVLSNNLGAAARTLNGNGLIAIGCVQDQFGFSWGFINGSNICALGCEVFNSPGTGTGNANNLTMELNGGTIIGCNIHDVKTTAIYTSSGVVAINNIIAKCAGYGVQVDNAASAVTICNNTIDGGAVDGIQFVDQTYTSQARVYNNIISNHVTGGRAGIKVVNGTAAVNDRIKQFVDYNIFYNNTSNYTNISAGPHDTALGVTPYIASGTENYTLA